MCLRVVENSKLSTSNIFKPPNIYSILHNSVLAHAFVEYLGSTSIVTILSCICALGLNDLIQHKIDKINSI
jgi:hypothetical protein